MVSESASGSGSVVTGSSSTVPLDRRVRTLEYNMQLHNNSHWNWWFTVDDWLVVRSMSVGRGPGDGKRRFNNHITDDIMWKGALRKAEHQKARSSATTLTSLLKRNYYKKLLTSSTNVDSISTKGLTKSQDHNRGSLLHMGDWCVIKSHREMLLLLLNWQRKVCFNMQIQFHYFCCVAQN